LDSDKIEPSGLKVDDFDTISLDDYVASHGVSKVNMIKMDIEGAEMQALTGAKSVIAKHKPRLAISIYHKIDDYWEIPLAIKAMDPSYKLAFGHHTPALGESMIYAY